MLKKTITYTDYNGETRTEDFLFNLSKAECMEMELSTAGGMQEMINRIIAEKDMKKLIALFKDLILKAYGEKSPDGKHFYKSPEISSSFACTEAYSELFMELASNADSAAMFIRGIVPEIPMEAQIEVDNALAKFEQR